MEVILSQEAEKLVREHIARGAYRDASELIDEAVHLLLDSDRAEAELESLVRDGIESDLRRKLPQAIGGSCVSRSA